MASLHENQAFRMRGDMPTTTASNCELPGGGPEFSRVSTPLRTLRACIARLRSIRKFREYTFRSGHRGGIMTRSIECKLTSSKRPLLSVGGTTAVVVQIIVSLAWAPQISAQTAGSIAFEVASVKPHKAEQRTFGFPRFLPGGRFTSSGVPLLVVVAVAYNLPFQGGQLSGGPEWIRSLESAYDIEDKAEAYTLQGVSPKDRADKLRLMLLAERFKLTVRRQDGHTFGYFGSAVWAMMSSDFSTSIAPNSRLSATFPLDLLRSRSQIHMDVS